MKRVAWSWFCCKLLQYWQKALVLAIDLTDMRQSILCVNIEKDVFLIFIEIEFLKAWQTNFLLF